MANITQQSLSLRGTDFIKEFNIYCASRDINYRPTIQAMNAFSPEEWEDFISWESFRKRHTYEEIVSWGWDEEMIFEYFPYEVGIRNTD